MRIGKLVNLEWVNFDFKGRKLVVGKQAEDIELGIHQEGHGKANHLLAGDQVQKKVNKT